MQKRWTVLLGLAFGTAPALSGCSERLDPSDPVEAALAAELREFAARCGEGDRGESDLEDFPVFASDRDFLDGRASITPRDGPRSVTATFKNGVTITSSFGPSRAFADFRPSDAVVTWPTADGGTRRVCGSADSVVGVRSPTNTPFLFLIDVVAEGDDCGEPLTGRIRLCF